MKATYIFSAYNTETQLGYGTRDQALNYLRQLNSVRDINLYEMEETSYSDDEAKYLGAFLLSDCFN